jgi:hypothetical protein
LREPGLRQARHRRLAHRNAERENDREREEGRHAGKDGAQRGAGGDLRQADGHRLPRSDPRDQVRARDGAGGHQHNR